MKTIIHFSAAIIATITVVTFWLSSLLSEVFGSKEMIIAVKSAIPYGFFILIPALIVTGISGAALAKGRNIGVIGKKLRRMPFIAANGIIVLMPIALFLSSKAKAGDLDVLFYIVQAVELIAGFVNITLLSLNMRDGLRLKRASNLNHS